MVAFVSRSEVGEYLRSRRASVSPAEVGLPDGSLRRTPGLRRQEVAQLAGISVEYYVKLEQGRGSRPSGQVLAALSRALLLTQDERTYLFRLAGEPVERDERPSQVLSPSVRFLLENMPEVPAYVIDAAWNVIEANDLAVHFIGELLEMPEGDRNLARWMFRAPMNHPYWHEDSAYDFAALVTRDLRTSFLRYPGYQELELLTAELRAVSSVFRDLWDSRETDSLPVVLKKLTVPGRGDFFFDLQLLGIAETGQQLVTYCSDPGSPVREALMQLQSPRSLPS